MKIWRYLLVGLIAFSFIDSTVYAAPVGLISKADVVNTESWSDRDKALGVGFIMDFLTDRKMEIDSGKLKMRSYAIKLELNLAEKYNFYLDLGRVRDMEYSYILRGGHYVTKFGDDFIWTLGANALLYRASNGLELGVHASYRRAEMNLSEATIDGTVYRKDSMSSVSDGFFKERQIAFEVAWNADYVYDIPYGFIPYVGLKYSDVEVDVDFTVGGTQRNASAKEDQSIGLFVGFTIIPRLEALSDTNPIAINIEGRFIDEQAVDVEMMYRF